MRYAIVQRDGKGLYFYYRDRVEPSELGDVVTIFGGRRMKEVIGAAENFLEKNRGKEEMLKVLTPAEIAERIEELEQIR